MRDALPVRYLIAGAGGMLGTALRQVLLSRGEKPSAPPEAALDITDPAAVLRETTRFSCGLLPGQRGVLLNAAAYTDVERAEDDPERAYLVNETGARLLAEAARSTGLGFVHVSTDFVFDGTKRGPYMEADEPNPLSVYGASKLAGERAVFEAYPGALVVRTAWVFGPAGVNFVTKILEAARMRPALSVVSDEIGSPTYTLDLATGILGLVEAGTRGLFHLAGSGSASRFEFARAILREAGLETPIAPVASDTFPTRAARPLNSVLAIGKAASMGVTMPAWQSGLARFVADLDSERA
jgi:dTDP-4-dehydrorhamnose reductase